jgi:hypothetical protein
MNLRGVQTLSVLLNLPARSGNWSAASEHRTVTLVTNTRSSHLNYTHHRVVSTRATLHPSAVIYATEMRRCALKYPNFISTV